MYGTDISTEPIRRTRQYETTSHRPRNTKRDKRRDAKRVAEALDSLYADQPRLLGEW